MKTSMRLILVFIGITLCLEAYTNMSKAVPVEDLEYLELSDRARERAERTRNRILGRSPSIGSNRQVSK